MVGGILLAWFGSNCPLSDYLRPVMKQFCPDWNDLPQGHSVPIHRTQGANEWFENENDVNLEVSQPSELGWSPVRGFGLICFRALIYWRDFQLFSTTPQSYRIYSKGLYMLYREPDVVVHVSVCLKPFTGHRRTIVALCVF